MGTCVLSDYYIHAYSNQIGLGIFFNDGLNISVALKNSGFP